MPSAPPPRETARRGRPRAVLCVLAWFAAWLITATVITPVFLINAAGTASPDFYATWQLDSEANVLNRVEAELRGVSVSPLGLLWADPAVPSVYERIGSSDFPKNADQQGVAYRPYTAQLGGYAHVVSWAYSTGLCSSLSCLHLVNAWLFSLLAVLFTALLWHWVSRGMAAAWILAIIGSPWIVAAAKNLYWSPWLWLLPAVAAFGMLTASRRLRWLALVGVYAAFVAKYVLTGYEVFTSLTVMAATVPLLSWAFRQRERKYLPRALGNAVMIGCASLAAFATTLVIHAQVRSGDIVKGLEAIWQTEVLRRTYGDAQGFDPVYAESLNAGPLSAIPKYVFEWGTSLLVYGYQPVVQLAFGPRALLVLSLLAAGVVMILAIRRDPDAVPYLLTLVAGAAVAISWFIAAKAHSYIHTHILFFLWYLLYVPALLLVTGGAGIKVYRSASLPLAWRRTLGRPDGRNPDGTRP